MFQPVFGADGTKRLIPEFEALHSSIRVDGVLATEVVSRTQAELVAGSSPDVAQLIFKDLDFIADNFNALPMDDIVGSQEWADHIKDFHPRGLALEQQIGKTYGIAYADTIH